MKKTIVTITITTLVFVAGILAHSYISNMQRGSHQVSGVVKYYTPDYTASGEAPEGYYVESSAIDKVYIEHQNIADYTDKHINARGYLKEICGNDFGSCFPLIDAQTIDIAQ